MSAKSEVAVRNQKTYQKIWKQNNRARVNAAARKRYTTDGRWEKQLKDRFNLTAERYWGMYEEQGGVCKICKRPQTVGTKLDVDHNHATRKVRALLCRHCNTGIGLLKDNLDIVWAAVQYLLGFEL